MTFGQKFAAILSPATIVIAGLLFTAYTPPSTQRLRATGPTSLYVATNGIDSSNDCQVQATPCQTPQYALIRAMYDWDFAGRGDPYIRLAPGIYMNGGVWMGGQPLGAHTVNVVGAQSADESCTLGQAQQVILQTSSPTTIFDFEDLAIGVVRCLTVQGSGSTGFSCRQTSASDIAFVQFGGSIDLSGGGISASDGCGINLSGTIWLGNNIGQFIAAANLSRVTIGNGVSITAINPVNVTYFANSYQKAMIEFRGGVTINGRIIPGAASMVWRGGTIMTNGLPIPGGVIQADPNEPGYIY